jgi:hypothetical protein
MLRSVSSPVAGQVPTAAPVRVTTATRTADDRVLAATRRASWGIVAILVPAAVVLWGLPGRTADAWAWPVKPAMSAVFMGAGYTAGAYFFARVAAARRWHTVSAGVLSASVFAALMLVPTFVHYDRFNHGHAPAPAAVAFYGWVVVYVAAPALVAVLWWRNQRLDPRDDAPPAVPLAARGAAAFLGGCALTAAAAVLLAPSLVIGHWEWKLTPLTAQVLACFTAQVGCGALLLALDRRWSAWRVLLQAFLLASSLVAVGTLRVGGAGIAFVGPLIVMAVIVAAFYAVMERRV